MEPSQLSLFGGSEGEDAYSRLRRVKAVDASEEDRQVMAGIPKSIYLGTSSWTFPGWRGLVYSEKTPEGWLAKHGLPAYASSPYFRTVGLDRTHYTTLEVEEFRAYASQVPPDFRFLVKAHEACTLVKFPTHERYGRQRGTENSMFLDPAYAEDAVIGPMLSGLGEKAGPLLFQFAPQDPRIFGGGAGFAERLFRFLSALPRDPHYAVEIRNAELLTPEYAQALVETGVSHCFNVWSGMADLRSQWRVAGKARQKGLVVRWMLSQKLTYDEAKKRYFPFRALVDEDLENRRAIAGIAAFSVKQALPCFVIANNKAEGSSPLTIQRLARQIVESLG